MYKNIIKDLKLSLGTTDYKEKDYYIEHILYRIYSDFKDRYNINEDEYNIKETVEYLFEQENILYMLDKIYKKIKEAIPKNNIVLERDRNNIWVRVTVEEEIDRIIFDELEETFFEYTSNTKLIVSLPWEFRKSE